MPVRDHLPTELREIRIQRVGEALGAPCGDGPADRVGAAEENEPEGPTERLGQAQHRVRRAAPEQRARLRRLESPREARHGLDRMAPEARRSDGRQRVERNVEWGREVHDQIPASRDRTQQASIGLRVRAEGGCRLVEGAEGEGGL